MRFLCLFLAASCSFVAPNSAGATTYYAAGAALTASDSKAGTAASPWKPVNPKLVGSSIHGLAWANPLKEIFSWGISPDGSKYAETSGWKTLTLTP